MQIAIVQFPGSNCERETSLAVARAGMTPVPCLWNAPKDMLTSMDGYVIVGGFSYEDRGRAGIIAAMHPVMQLIKQQAELGKPVLGICNGAQILVETGMVPGYKHYPVSMALTNNKRITEGNVLGTGFYNAWVDLKSPASTKTNAFNRCLPDKAMIHIPSAHAEGKFVINDNVLTDIREQGLIAWQYCDKTGEIHPEFPVNPNGSVDNIAAITNVGGNVMAIMPHPERCEAGDCIFHSMKDYLTSTKAAQPLKPAPSLVTPSMPVYQANSDAYDLYVDLIINDNAAFTVSQSIQSLAPGVTVSRLQHWSVHCDSKTVLHQIQASGVLYNDQKEFLVDHQGKANQRTFLVRAKEDMLGQQKKQHLQHHFGIGGIEAIEHGVIWKIGADANDIDKVTDAILQSHILYNPVSHVCYRYD